MSDFASAAMVRILSAGMRMAGLVPPPLPPGDAHVGLQDKRALVGAAVAQGGWGVLPQLGLGIEALRGDPVHRALAGAGGPLQLMERWCRLERYIHSRHRITWTPAGAHALDVRHMSLAASKPPLPYEDLVVLGVLAAALREDGVRGVRASVAGVPAYPHADAQQLGALAEAGRTGAWRLEWTHAPGAVGADGAQDAAGAGDATPVPAVVDAVARLVHTDLMCPQPVEAVAQQLGLSGRSLQRALAQHGTSYSALVTQARCRAAASHLVRQQPGVAEIGFLCGFSDQAHFTRVFSRCVGLPPARYRKEFARPAARAAAA